MKDLRISPERLQVIRSWANEARTDLGRSYWVNVVRELLGHIDWQQEEIDEFEEAMERIAGRTGHSAPPAPPEPDEDEGVLDSPDQYPTCWKFD